MISQEVITEAVVNLTMQGLGAKRIADRIGIPQKEVEKIKREEFIFPPSQIGRFFRPPATKPATTPEEIDRMVALYHDGQSFQAIADTLGTTYGNVIMQLRLRGVQIQLKNRPWRIPEYDYLLEHVEDPWEETARVLNRSRDQVKHRYCMLRRMGLPVPERRKRRAAKSS